jgi:hypothetical protein
VEALQHPKVTICLERGDKACLFYVFSTEPYLVISRETIQQRHNLATRGRIRANANCSIRDSWIQRYFLELVFSFNAFLALLWSFFYATVGGGVVLL